MTQTMNRRAHAVAAQVFGSDAHEQLRALAAQHGFSRWSDVTEDVAGIIVLDLQTAARSGAQLADQVAPDRSTRKQRDRIAALRYALNWPWSKIRAMVEEYGVTDWTQLTAAQANNLIQRLGQISATYKRKAQHADHHSA